MQIAFLRTSKEPIVVRKIPAAMVLGMLMSACTTLSDESPADPQKVNTEQYAAWQQKAAPDIGTQLHNPLSKSKKGSVPEITNR
jgi:hypothetical protein